MKLIIALGLALTLLGTSSSCIRTPGKVISPTPCQIPTWPAEPQGNVVEIAYQGTPGVWMGIDLFVGVATHYKRAERIHEELVKCPWVVFSDVP
jgi:hypothetical protein